MAVSTRNSSKRRSHASSASAASKRSRRRRTGGRSNAGASRGDDDASVVSDDASPDILISPRPNEFSQRTWWMVDMEHGDNEEEGSNQGATALVKRCMRTHGWSLEKARKILTAYRQFLALKKEREDWDASILSPSLLVDQMWHQHILDVVNYCHDMVLLCGRVVGYNPDGALDGKAERDEATRQALEERFSNFDKEVWGVDTAVEEGNGIIVPANNHANDNDFFVITIIVKDQTGEETMFTIKGTTKMGKVFNTYAARKGVPPVALRFLINGDRIGPNETPETLDLDDYDQIDVILSQLGC